MIRIVEALEASRPALAAYLVAGDPRPEATVPCMHALVEAGADLIELGVPFTDPMADGPVIQRAHERALAAGANAEAVLGMVAAFRESNAATPVVLMGHANILARRPDLVASRARVAGVDGALVVDLPFGQSEPMRAALRSYGLGLIDVVATTTPLHRAMRIASAAEGFLYCLALKGVSGAGHLDPESLREPVAALRTYTDTPIAVGFGIQSAAQLAAVSELADMAVVGSVLVERIEEMRDAPVAGIASALGERLTELRAA